MRTTRVVSEIHLDQLIDIKLDIVTPELSSLNLDCVPAYRVVT